MNSKNQRNGYGKSTYTNGNVYQGEYRKVKKHGYGKYLGKTVRDTKAMMKKETEQDTVNILGLPEKI